MTLSGHHQAAAHPALYTEAERQRRDASPWTVVQAILAPIQFLIFLISLVLVIRSLTTGEGVVLAHASILAKTAALYAIMVTGSLWEKDVFDRYLFAPAFFWEDAVSFVVIGLHTLYVAGLLLGLMDDRTLFGVALLAYATYAVNALQFLLKLRAARLSAPRIEATGDPA